MPLTDQGGGDWGHTGGSGEVWLVGTLTRRAAQGRKICAKQVQGKVRRVAGTGTHTAPGRGVTIQGTATQGCDGQ